jgi:hypothetical protein
MSSKYSIKQSGFIFQSGDDDLTRQQNCLNEKYTGPLPFRFA